MSSPKNEGRLIWMSAVAAGDILVPQLGTFNEGRNAAKRLKRLAQEQAKAARKKPPKRPSR